MSYYNNVITMQYEWNVCAVVEKKIRKEKLAVKCCYSHSLHPHHILFIQTHTMASLRMIENVCEKKLNKAKEQGKNRRNHLVI